MSPAKSSTPEECMDERKEPPLRCIKGRTQPGHLPKLLSSGLAGRLRLCRYFATTLRLYKRTLFTFTHPPIHPPHSPTYSPTYLAIHPSTHPPAHPPTHPPTHPPAHPPIRLPIYPASS